MLQLTGFMDVSVQEYQFCQNLFAQIFSFSLCAYIKIIILSKGSFIVTRVSHFKLRFIVIMSFINIDLFCNVRKTNFLFVYRQQTCLLHFCCSCTPNAIFIVCLLKYSSKFNVYRICDIVSYLISFETKKYGRINTRYGII